MLLGVMNAILPHGKDSQGPFAQGAEAPQWGGVDPGQGLATELPPFL